LIRVPSLIESARVGTDALRANPLRTVLSTTGVIIGVAALVAAFAITDGVAVWSRDMLARESSVQDVAVTPVTMEVVNGHTRRVRGYPVFDMTDADRAGAEVPGVMRYALTLNGTSAMEYLDRRESVHLTLEHSRSG
jgi:putative ABC transport system permease protein